MTEPRPAWRQRNVLTLGLVSMLTDVSSEMILPLVPLFLTTVVGGGAVALGGIEGLADGVSSALKLWSGRVADRTGRLRPLVGGGYTLSSVSRPLVALAASPWHVLGVRVLDRVGKGIRTSARDALLAASVPESQRGAAFGFHRGMDHAGAVIGPLLAVALLTWWTDDLRLVFAASAVPAALAVLAVWLGVEETAPRASAPAPARLGAPVRAAAVPVLLPVTLFALAHASDTFLLLAAGANETDPRALPLLWTALHVVKAASSLPGGLLADRIGARPTLLLGWGLHAACYAALAVVDDLFLIVAIVLLYGVHQGLSEPAERKLVASLAPEGARGEAFGWYHASVGIGGVVASVGFGALWTAVSPSAAFATGSALAAAAALLVLLTSVLPRPTEP